MDLNDFALISDSWLDDEATQQDDLVNLFAED